MPMPTSAFFTRSLNAMFTLRLPAMVTPFISVDGI